MRDKIYGRILRLSVNWRYPSIAMLLLFIMLIIGMMNGNIIQKTNFPIIDRDDITLDLVLTPGTNDKITESALREIQTQIWEVNDYIKNTRTDKKDVIVGTTLTVGSSGLETGNHTGQIQIQLLDGETRNIV